MEVVKAWSKTMKLINRLYKDDNLYYYDLLLLSVVYELEHLSGQVKRDDVLGQYPGITTSIDKKLLLLINEGYLTNNKEGRAHNYKVTMKGEMLLRRYSEELEKLVNG